jgi:hypothetical protein
VYEQPHRSRKRIIRRSTSLKTPPVPLDDPSSNDGLEQKLFPLYDRFTTLKETLEILPIDLGFVVELKYPADWAKRAYNIVYHERNPLVDKVLEVSHHSLIHIPFSSYIHHQ